MRWFVASLLLLSACSERNTDHGPPGPCEGNTDCPTSQVCFQSECTDSLAGLEYRVVGVTVDHCFGQYGYTVSFDSNNVGQSSQWDHCPAAWPDGVSEPFMPTEAREPLRLIFAQRYGDPDIVTLDWEDGIPVEVLHYGQWYGWVGSHRIAFGVELLD